VLQFAGASSVLRELTALTGIVHVAMCVVACCSVLKLIAL